MFLFLLPILVYFLYANNGINGFDFISFKYFICDNPLLGLISAVPYVSTPLLPFIYYIGILLKILK